MSESMDVPQYDKPVHGYGAELPAAEEEGIGVSEAVPESTEAAG